MDTREFLHEDIYIYNFDSWVEIWTRRNPTDRSLLGRKCRCAVVWFWEKLKHAKTCAPIVEVKIIVYLKIMTGIQTGQPFDRPTNKRTARLIVSLPIRRQKWLWEFISRTHRCKIFIQGVPDYMEGPHKESKTSKNPYESFFLFPSSLFEKRRWKRCFFASTPFCKLKSFQASPIGI